MFAAAREQTQTSSHISGLDTSASFLLALSSISPGRPKRTKLLGGRVSVPQR